MNGAQALVASFEQLGVTVCYANPGTSEVHIVAALDERPAVRSVLCLFEGVATGAADGFGRMAGAPAATLLHLGPGLANGLAGLHNAKRGRSPVLNVVGDSAVAHKLLDPPLESDVVALAGTMSRSVRTAGSAATVGEAVLAAYRSAVGPPAGVATLIVPADVSWSDGGQCASAAGSAEHRPVDEAVLSDAAAVLRRPAVTVLLGGEALGPRGQTSAARLARATGVRVMVEPFPTRLAQGGGLPPVERLSGDSMAARRELAGTRHLLLAASAVPVAPFAYPGLPGALAPADCQVDVLAAADEDVVAALEQLADRAGGPPADDAAAWPPSEAAAAAIPGAGGDDEPLTSEVVARVVAALLPEGAVVVDEANTSGAGLAAAMPGAARHDLLTVSGFAIGHGLPMAIGAAMACPGQRVVCLEADGSAMYTLPALWTHAREGLDIVTVVLVNRSYAILQRESLRLLGEPQQPAGFSRLFDLSSPDLDYASLAAGMGVPSRRARTAGELRDQLRRALAESGPTLIEASLAPSGRRSV